jgi:ABC-type nickel/cobalt efflux system permease component RcnA
MTEFSTLLQQGNAWLFIPSAIVLGALHGLEPGHSKTMMAAFIVAVRGTLAQAVLLGLAATVSHTAVVWAVAVAGLYFGSHWNVEASEPVFQLASAALIIGVACWMLWRTWRSRQQAAHAHDHDHGHRHGPAAQPHQDPHALAHATDIRRRFANQQVTTGQIMLFGLTGGLIPCPASITVLLLCLQLKQIALGATLVLSFSIGLALTLVASGALAALSVKHAARRWAGFGAFADHAPYISGGLIVLVGLYVGYQGWSALS